jgi:glutaryl-CoA dehydrogenase
LSHTQAVQIRLAEMVRQLATGAAAGAATGATEGPRHLTAAAISLGKWNNCRIALDIARDCRDLLGGPASAASTSRSGTC